MGTWGTSIFSDDTACDIRNEYKEFVGEGLSSEKATEKLLLQYSDVISDIDEMPVFWLALAATQWKCGRLLEDVKSKALDTIDSGLDLTRWKYDEKQMLKRKEVLQKLKSELTSPQPQAKRIPKAFKDTCEFDINDAVSFKLASGKYTIFKVITLITDKGGTHPLFEICDWVGTEIPSVEQINELKPICKERYSKLSIGAVSKSEYPRDRLNVIGKNTKINLNGNTPYTLILWRDIDKSLEQFYGFR